MSILRGRKQRGDDEERDVFLDGRADPETCRRLTGRLPDKDGRCPMLLRQYGKKTVLANDEIDIIRTGSEEDDYEQY